MANERVIVIDPGERVGWATCEITPAGRIVKLEQGVTPLKEFALRLYRETTADQFQLVPLPGAKVYGGPKYDTIVYETWRLYSAKAKELAGDEMLSSQLIGMIRMCAWLAPNRPAIVGIGPKTKVTGRKVMPAALLARLKHSSEEHDKDALDLLSYYRWKHYGAGRKK